MIGIVLGVILHLVLLFGAVIVAKIAENRDIIDDAEFALCMSIFLPAGVIIFIAALWIAEVVSDNLS